MKINLKYIFLLAILIVSIAGFSVFSQLKSEQDDRIVAYVLNSKKQDFKLYWKDKNKENYKSLSNLKSKISSKNEKLVFAMNGGMYKKDGSPQGLYIENYKVLTNLDSGNGDGNFYLKPNGIFYFSENVFQISTTSNFKFSKNIKYATQSGPMLVIDGKIHPEFKRGSTNLNIRNGVGILPDNAVLFAMSKDPINFYDFANYFKSKGCKNALYLDGLVSRMYLPEENWVQTDGNFGVIIGVTSK